MAVGSNVLSAFNELSASFNAGVLKDKALSYEPAIAARLSKAGQKLTPDFLSDFASAVKNQESAAQSPPDTGVNILSQPMSLLPWLIGGILLLWLWGKRG